MYKVEKSIRSIDLKTYVKGYRDAERFIEFCKKCPKYNKFWTCPSFDYNPKSEVDFDVDYFLHQYSHATIIGYKVIINPYIIRKVQDDKIQTKLLKGIYSKVRALSDAEILELEAKTPNSVALYAGSCVICPKCTKRTIISKAKQAVKYVEKLCLYPEIARYSLEALGFDVGKTTVELFDTELKWGKDGQLPEYLFLVSALFEQRDIEN